MTRAALPLLVLALGACLHPPSGLSVVGGTEAQRAEVRELVACAAKASGDLAGWLAGDLGVTLTTRYEIGTWCGAEVPGCAWYDGERAGVAVDAARSDLRHLLAHEFCHLGLTSADQGLADQCAAVVAVACPSASP